MKPTRCTLAHQRFLKIPKAQQEAPWFRKSQGDKQNKQTFFFLDRFVLKCVGQLFDLFFPLNKWTNSLHSEIGNFIKKI